LEAEIKSISMKNPFSIVERQSAFLVLPDEWPFHFHVRAEDFCNRSHVSPLIVIIN
jgi:hypothetical protein